MHMNMLRFSRMDILREVSLPALNNVEDAIPELLGFIFFSRMETLTIFPFIYGLFSTADNGAHADTANNGVLLYITTLSGRKKWNVERDNPRVNDVVLVAEDNVPRHRWRLGIVAELLPGQDGLVRTVRVKTAAGVICLPTRKLHLLESASSP
ncbi:hypothetical protein M513_07756 [Trichuris suis]|uniref:DUF5641 domain-containing protein n=1 Tax=Trichuris suis TaxID=68888 RepID=A0A085M2A5_9BILA|nr:hypothetical protein M513_07756 [Trichuris suis]